MMESTARQAISFAGIGAIGFVVDAGILTICNSALELDLLSSRLISFSVAVTVTWALNRHRTFSHRKDRRAAREWSRYALVNGAGALLNMAVFFWLVYQYRWLADWPIVPLAIASAVAMVFNFFMSKHLAFRRRQS